MVFVVRFNLIFNKVYINKVRDKFLGYFNFVDCWILSFGILFFL